jgi:hypothetical protein
MPMKIKNNFQILIISILTLLISISCNSKRKLLTNNFNYILYIKKNNKQWIDNEHYVYLLNNLEEINDYKKTHTKELIFGDVVIPNYYDKSGKKIFVRDTTLIAKSNDISLIENDKNSYSITLTNNNTKYIYQILKVHINYIDCTNDCELFFSKEKNIKYYYPLNINSLKISVKERKKIRNFINQYHIHQNIN